MSTDAAHPSDATPPLPDDPVVLKQMIAELLATLRESQRDNEHLRARLDQMLRRLYGPRTERVSAEQLLLFADVVPRRRRRHRNRSPRLLPRSAVTVVASRRENCRASA